jgi:D-amino-acid dehydrogenase
MVSLMTENIPEKNNKDILIIGGGVIGVCAAYYLAGQGRSVTLMEKDDICAGSSYGNVGWIAVGHAIPLAVPGVLTQGLKWLMDAGSPFYIKPRPNLELLRWLWQFQAACTKQHVLKSIPVLLSLGRQSMALFEELATAEKLDFGYNHQGMLHLYATPTGFQKGLKEALLLREFGVETVELDHNSLREMEPNLLDAVAYGIYYPEYAHITPDRFVKAMARTAQSRGVSILTETELLNFEIAGSRITAVNTTQGTFQPQEVVLAAGAWSAVLARQLGLRLPVQPAKGYSITVKRPPTCPRLPLSLDEHKIAVTPMGDTLRFSSTLELAGFDPAINQRRVEATRQGIRLYLPGLDNPEIIEIWRGYRPVSPDGLPIIGRSRSFENLIIATGHGMLGMTQGPITGKLVSQLVAGKEPAVDLAPLRVERF